MGERVRARRAACGYVDNCCAVPHIPTGSTTTGEINIFDPALRALKTGNSNCRRRKKQLTLTTRSTFGRSTVDVGYFDPNRGRDAGYPAPPAQIRAGALTHTAPASGQTSAALSATCRLARLRGPQAACVTRTRHSVRYVLWPVDLPLAPVLRSIDSAGTLIPLFADFTATMTESDSSSPFVSGYDSSVFPSRPRH